MGEGGGARGGGAVPLKWYRRPTEIALVFIL